MNTLFKQCSIVGCHLGGIVLIIGSYQLKLNAIQAAGSIDLINCHLCGILHCNTVNSCATGQRAGHANYKFTAAAGFVATAGEHCSYHHSSHQDCEKLFHNKRSPFHFLKKRRCIRTRFLITDILSNVSTLYLTYAHLSTAKIHYFAFFCTAASTLDTMGIHTVFP